MREIEPKSVEAASIVESVRLERSAAKISGKSFNCVVLGPGTDGEHHGRRIAMKNKACELKHQGYFPEIVDCETARQYLTAKGADAQHIEVVASDTFTRKNMLILYSDIILILVEGVGAIAEFVDCFRDMPQKTYAFIDKEKFCAESEIGMRCKDIIDRHGAKRICTYQDDGDLMALVEAILIMEIRASLR